MALFVINEWLWHDVSGQNQATAQRQALDFIERFAASEHQVVIIEGSQFDQKMWANHWSDKTTARLIARLFFGSVRENLDRCRVLKPEAVSPPPEELSSSVNPDDHYLICAQLSVPGAVLVTTDTQHRERATQAGLPCLSREEFLNTYFGT